MIKKISHMTTNRSPPPQPRLGKKKNNPSSDFSYNLRKQRLKSISCKILVNEKTGKGRYALWPPRYNKIMLKFE